MNKQNLQAIIAKPDVFQAEEWQTLAIDILREAEILGASGAEVDMSMGKGFTVNSRLGEVETVEYHQGKHVNITVYFGKRLGTASLSDTRWPSVQAAVQAACHIARYTQEDPCAGLADPELLALNCSQTDTFYPWDITVEQAIELACACEKEGLSLDKRIANSEGVTVATSEAWHLYANSEQFMGLHSGTHHDITSTLVAKKNDEMQRDHSYTISCDPQLLIPISILAKQAVEKTVSRLGARRLSTRRAPVIFIAEEARSLFRTFISAISGGNLFRKSSFLLNQLGKPVFPATFKIFEQPLLPKGLGSAAFDEDGLPTRNNVFVEDGILKNYALSVYSARQLGMQPTGNAGGVHNLTIKTGEKDLVGLLKAMDTGLLVTEVMGSGINLVTGAYSRGASGFWVENGEIQYPVQEVTVAGNLKDMFAYMVEVGNDVDVRGNIRTGSVLLEEMMVAGE